ncbi:Zinc finger domain containing protein [Hondaea fermentalgiana]|uniref:Zinc finger domain containing protein n=1 Tax=Hondaea fermentalgiana TaxID=2315210 RepID=A0A2R5GP82_9STRA|nr:Zinc finger domain containing protein [Hondaea fermentalgiana]|eukprot:GBG32686.1 Zinc finger domain containing protein [Hondaea fermentalgiana]
MTSWNAEENDSELEQELELLQAMYTPEELRVEPREDDDVNDAGKDAAVILEVALEHVRATFRFELPARFPLAAAPRVSLARSRGLVDSEELEMRQRLEAQIAETFEAMGRYSLVDLLLLAKDLVQECSDQGGTCAICLCELEPSDSAFRANCWHTFHRACFAAWYKQVEARRTQAGTAHSQASLQRKQALSALTARVTERETSVAKAEARVENLREEKERLQALADFIDAGGDAAQFEAIAAGEETMSASAARKRANAVDADAKRARGEVGPSRAKLHKAREELAAMESEHKAKASLEEQQGMDCPMCKVPIAYEEFCDSLEGALSALTQGGKDSSGTFVPRAWAEHGKNGEGSNGSKQGISGAQLTDEQRELFARQAAERQALFEQQRLKGGIIDSNDAAGDFVRIDAETEAARAASMSVDPPLSRSSSASSTSKDGVDTAPRGKRGRGRRRGGKGGART